MTKQYLAMPGHQTPAAGAEKSCSSGPRPSLSPCTPPRFPLTGSSTGLPSAGQRLMSPPTANRQLPGYQPSTTWQEQQAQLPASPTLGTDECPTPYMWQVQKPLVIQQQVQREPGNAVHGYTENKEGDVCSVALHVTPEEPSTQAFS